MWTKLERRQPEERIFPVLLRSNLAIYLQAYNRISLCNYICTYNVFCNLVGCVSAVSREWHH